jgi:hypothetical protein
MADLLSQLLSIDPRIVLHVQGDAACTRSDIGSNFTQSNVTSNYDIGACHGSAPIRATFNGSSSLATSPSQATDSTLFPTTLTFLTRFRSGSSTNSMRIVCSRTATATGGLYGYDLAANIVSGNLEIAVLAGGASAGTTLINFTRTASGISSGWHTVGFSVTTTTNTVARIWYDGAQLSTTGSMTGTMTYGGTSATIILGNFDSGATPRYLNGDLAYTTIWNAELTAEQVNAAHLTFLNGPSRRSLLAA